MHASTLHVRRLRIQQHHLEPLMTVTSPQMCLQSLTDMATESNYWLGFLVFLYLFCGIIRMPGQMVLHTLLGFALGFKTAFPIALAANTVTSCALFYLGMLYARGGSGEAWQYYAAKIDVFLLKISQARFGIYVDDLGQYYDKGKQAEMAKGALSLLSAAHATSQLTLASSANLVRTVCRQELPQKGLEGGG